MIFSIHALSNNTRLLDNPDIFPHDNLFLYIKSEDNRSDCVLVFSEAGEDEITKLLRNTLLYLGFTRFLVSKDELKMYFKNTDSDLYLGFTRSLISKDELKMYFKNTDSELKCNLLKTENLMEKLISSKN